MSLVHREHYTQQTAAAHDLRLGCGCAAFVAARVQDVGDRPVDGRGSHRNRKIREGRLGEVQDGGVVRRMEDTVRQAAARIRDASHKVHLSKAGIPAVVGTGQPDHKVLSMAQTVGDAKDPALLGPCYLWNPWDPGGPVADRMGFAAP